MSICTSYHCKKMQIIFTVHPSDHKKSYLAIYDSVTNSSCKIAIFTSNVAMLTLEFIIFLPLLCRKWFIVGNTVLRSTISLTLTSFKKRGHLEFGGTYRFTIRCANWRRFIRTIGITITYRVPTT